MPVGASLLLPAACLPVLLHGIPSSKGAAERWPSSQSTDGSPPLQHCTPLTLPCCPRPATAAATSGNASPRQSPMPSMQGSLYHAGASGAPSPAMAAAQEFEGGGRSWRQLWGIFWCPSRNLVAL